MYNDDEAVRDYEDRAQQLVAGGPVGAWSGVRGLMRVEITITSLVSPITITDHSRSHPVQGRLLLAHTWTGEDKLSTDYRVELVSIHDSGQSLGTF